MRLIPPRDVVCTEFVSRIPAVNLRMRAYRRLGLRIAHHRVTIMMHTELLAPRGVEIGEDSIVGRHCVIDGRGGIRIGRNVNLSSHVQLITGDHDPQSTSFAARFRPILIEDYVWLATRTTVLAGVSIGRGAVVAAGAVVTRDLDPMTIYAGVPARAVGTRDSELSYTVDHRPDWY